MKGSEFDPQYHIPLCQGLASMGPELEAQKDQAHSYESHIAKSDL